MRNHYVLTPGEFFTAREILKHRKDVTLCFPILDRGWDLLAVKNGGEGAPVRIQVKESRVYVHGNPGRKKNPASSSSKLPARWTRSWHQIKKTKLADADIFVFVIYTPVVFEGKARTAFTEDFLVIPREQLKQQCVKKKCSGGKYSFYFGKLGDKWIECRDCPEGVDVSQFYDAWRLI
jgi:hypothetical protein